MCSLYLMMPVTFMKVVPKRTSEVFFLFDHLRSLRTEAVRLPSARRVRVCVYTVPCFSLNYYPSHELPLYLSPSHLSTTSSVYSSLLPDAMVSG